MKENKANKKYGVIVSGNKDIFIVKVITTSTLPRNRILVSKERKYKVPIISDKKVGDRVMIEQTRKISKEVNWRIIC